MDSTAFVLAASFQKKPRKRRGPGSNWLMEEAARLIQLYGKYHKIISSPIMVHAWSEKEKAWCQLVQEFNQNPPNNSNWRDWRDMQQIKNKISNTKDTARKYAYDMKDFLAEKCPQPSDPPLFVYKMYELIWKNQIESSDITVVERGDMEMCGDEMINNEDNAGTVQSMNVKEESEDNQETEINNGLVERQDTISTEPQEVEPMTKYNRIRVETDEDNNDEPIKHSIMVEYYHMIKEYRELIEANRRKAEKETYKTELEILKLKHELKCVGVANVQ